MRGKEQCPICYGELEVRDCAPCYDCGWREIEINHFIDKVHTYAVYEVYDGLTLTLCNFCAVDFGSYKSEYLGFPDNRRIGFEHFHFINAVENPLIQKDKFCPECGQRFKFLIFLRDLREKIKG